MFLRVGHIISRTQTYIKFYENELICVENHHMYSNKPDIITKISISDSMCFIKKLELMLILFYAPFYINKQCN